MTRLIPAVACLAVLSMFSRTAIAIPPSPNLRYNGLNVQGGPRYAPQRPTVSPYLLLAPSSGTFGITNYYTLVRPQFQQQAINLQQNAALQQIETDLRSPTTGINPQTGQPMIRNTGARSGFNTHYRYFGNSYRGPATAPPLR